MNLISRGVAQPGSATVLGTVGRKFESSRPDQYKALNYLGNLHSFVLVRLIFQIWFTDSFRFFG